MRNRSVLCHFTRTRIWSPGRLISPFIVRRVGPLLPNNAQGRKGAAEFPGRERGQFLSCAVRRRRRGGPMRPQLRAPYDVRRPSVSMAQVSVAWLMSEDHCADRKDCRCDPNDDGGPLLGNAWGRFHGQNNRNVIIRFQRSHGQCRIPISTWGRSAPRCSYSCPRRSARIFSSTASTSSLGVSFARLWRSNENKDQTRTARSKALRCR
jgi:hypothetical protein